MTIQQGRVSLCRYRVFGLKKSTKLADLNKHFIPLKAKSIRLQGVHKPLQAGWVPPAALNLEASEGDWDLSECQTDSGFLLRMRIEKRQVPAPLLQLLTKQELSQIAARRSKPLKKGERQQIIADLKTELIGKCLPRLSYVECYWKDHDGQLLLFSTSRAMRTVFEELFAKTFGEPLGLRLVRIDPPLMGLPPEVWDAESMDAELVRRLSLTVPLAFSEHRL